MKRALFYTFLLVFLSTAIITLLGITKVIKIDNEFLTKLFYALILEAISPVIILFKKTEFFKDEESKVNRLNIVLIPKDSFGRDGDPHKCKITIYNHETNDTREIFATPLRENGYLNTYLDGIKEEELIRVNIENSRQELWESQYFSPSTSKAEMEKL